MEENSFVYEDGIPEDKYKRMREAIAQRDENGYLSSGFQNDLYSY